MSNWLSVTLLLILSSCLFCTVVIAEVFEADSSHGSETFGHSDPSTEDDFTETPVMHARRKLQDSVEKFHDENHDLNRNEEVVVDSPANPTTTSSRDKHDHCSCPSLLHNKDLVSCENEHLFVRRLVSSVLHHLNSPKTSDGFYHVSADILLDMDRYNVLGSFVNSESDNDSVQEAADILADSISYHRSEKPPKQTQNFIMRYQDEITTVTQIMLLIVLSGVVIFSSLLLWSRLGLWKFAFYLTLTLFLVSVPWTWVHLHKQNLAQRMQRADKRFVDFPECNPNKLTWTQYVFHNYNRECDKFYEDMIIDPLWETKPTTALAVTFVEFVWTPLGIMGEAPAKFLDDFLRPFPFYMKFVVSFIGMIFAGMVMVIFSGRRIMILSGWLFTVEPANTAQHQLDALNETVGELRHLIQRSGANNLSRDGEVIAVLGQITDQSTRQGELLDTISEQAANHNSVVQSLQDTLHLYSTNIKETITIGGGGDGAHRMAAARDIEFIDDDHTDPTPLSSLPPNTSDSLDVVSRTELLTQGQSVSESGEEGESFVVLPLREDNSTSDKQRYALGRPDHLVLNTKYPDEIIKFYRKLGMSLKTFGGGRQALHFGQFKINIHKHGEEITPHAELAAPGTIDICIVCECDIQTTLNHLEDAGVETELSDVRRTGALGPIQSVYVRDPDKNLIELAHYINMPSDMKKIPKQMSDSTIADLKCDT